MLFFLPIRTRAHAERFPLGTAVLILANVAVFLGGLLGLVNLEALALSWGEVTPLAWITSNFVHKNWLHLLGNMILLWSIGQIVEGTAGTKRFLVVALLIGAAQCALEQAVYIGRLEGLSFGASAMIFGLLATAVVWAPRSTVDTITVIFLWVRRVELSIGGLAAILLFFEVLYASLSFFAPSSAVLHLAGALVGLLLSVAALKLRWVDCGGWDWFSLRKRGPKPDVSVARVFRDRARGEKQEARW